MKAISTPILCLAALFLLKPPKVSAQTFIYNFSSPVMKVNGGNSGLAVGSVWVYSKIDAAATTDAVVKITNATAGLTLSTFDQDNTANGGYTPAFQPTISVPGTGGGATVNGYIEFQFTFIKTNTYSAATQTGALLSQTSVVPATVLDDDGTTTGGNLNEFDVLNLGAGEAMDYDASGGQLSFTTSGSYITGSNITGNNYSGISTSATAVMFTVINTNISSLTFRTGAKSTFTAAPAGRVSSLAFFMPTYPNSILAASPIGDFHGGVTAGDIDLSWQLNSQEGLSTLDLERSVNNGVYQAINSHQFGSGGAGGSLANGGGGITSIGGNIANGSGNSGGTAQSFTFTDAGLASVVSVTYRLKATAAAGNTWYSDVIGFKMPGSGRFGVYPNPVIHTATVNLAVATAGSGVLQLMDFTGHVISRQQVYLNQGNNSFYFQRPAGLPAGAYILLMQTGAETFTERIVLAVNP